MLGDIGVRTNFLIYILNTKNIKNEALNILPQIEKTIEKSESAPPPDGYVEEQKTEKSYKQKVSQLSESWGMLQGENV